MSNNEWIGVDLDGTLAVYDKWVNWMTIGDPVRPMVDRVKDWLRRGISVKILTARVSPESCAASNVDRSEVEKVIKAWCVLYIGQELPVTYHKDRNMTCLWDDRCVTVEKNTGRILTSPL